MPPFKEYILQILLKEDVLFPIPFYFNYTQSFSIRQDDIEYPKIFDSLFNTLSLKVVLALPTMYLATLDCHDLPQSGRSRNEA
jgi:hypothetical protein